MTEASTARWCKILLLMLVGIMSGCAEFTPYLPLDFPPEPETGTDILTEAKTVKETVPTHAFNLNGQDSLVGRLATVPVQEGDTLPDLARHFGLGYQHVVEANPGMDPWLPNAGERVLLPLQFILPEASRKGIVINLATMRLFYFAGGKNPVLLTWPIGIGREGRSTPLGIMTVERKMEHPTWYVPESIRKTHEQEGDPLPAIVPPGPDNPLGDYALYLSKPSYLIHGTNKPYSIGLRASNGCIRLYPEDIERAFRQIPKNIQVLVVNQPYLLGWKDGTLYLEAHQPFEEIDAKQEKDNMLAKLRLIEKKQQRKLDWPKIEKILKQARGIPTPIFEQTESLNDRLANSVPLERPVRLTGQPKTPEQVSTGWLLRTEATDLEFKTKRLAAQLNHLGPRIPARAVATNRRYQVIAGPFAQEKEAKKVQTILREDFATKSELVKPANMAGSK